MAKKYYAVLKGLTPGIYESWAEAEEQVKGFPGAEFKSFKTKKEATAYMGGEEVEKDEPELLDGLCAFVDGSFDSESKIYSYGIVYLYQGELKTENGVGTNEEAASMRNVAGELRGAMLAMKYASDNGFDKINIYHDYEGIAAWAEGRWKTNLSCTAAYKSYCEKMKSKIKVHFVKVPAHSGITYNEMADELAKAAVKAEKESR